MMLLFLFTYGAILLHCVTGFYTNFDNFPKNDNGLLDEFFQEDQDNIPSARSPRQNRFFSSPGNNFNQFSEIGNSRQNNDFDWNRNFNRNMRPSQQNDFIFVDEDNDFNDEVIPTRPRTTTQRTPRTTQRTPRPTQRTPSATIAIPGMATTRSPCENTCQGTMQFDPVCGDNNVTYTNIYWLRCAQRCGRNINVKYRGACPRVP